MPSRGSRQNTIPGSTIQPPWTTHSCSIFLFRTSPERRPLTSNLSGKEPTYGEYRWEFWRHLTTSTALTYPSISLREVNFKCFNRWEYQLFNDVPWQEYFLPSTNSRDVTLPVRARISTMPRPRTITWCHRATPSYDHVIPTCSTRRARTLPMCNLESSAWCRRFNLMLWFIKSNKWHENLDFG